MQVKELTCTSNRATGASKNTSTSRLTLNSPKSGDVIEPDNGAIEYFLLPPACHVCLADNMVCILDKHRIYRAAISDIKETVPTLNDVPQRLEGFGTTVADHPCQDPRLFMVHGYPNKRVCCVCCPQIFEVRQAQ